MAKHCYLVHGDNTPQKAAFAAIDAHNHLWGATEATGTLAAMDATGVVSYCDLTANRSMEWAEGGYAVGPGGFEAFLGNYARKYPGRFYGFTMSRFACPKDRPLFTDAGRFVAECIGTLDEHVTLGARGLKILKSLGLDLRDGDGKLVAIDDERIADIFEHAGELDIPVLVHQSDPVGFFEPITEENEHYGSLQKYPQWSFADPKFPPKAQIIAQRDNLIRRHPKTTFILAHVANWAEDLAYVSRLLEANPNAHIDFSARIDELGRQPYTAREFFIRHQDRIVFGTDMPASVEMYRCYFRFLETFDEYFFAPDYDGTFGRARWAICGIGLPKDVLKKIYQTNALRLIPHLKQELLSSGLIKEE